MSHNELAFSIITLIIWCGSPLTKGRCFSFHNVLVFIILKYEIRYKLLPRCIFGSISI